MFFTEEFKWIKDFIDVEKLAKGILERSKRIKVEGILIKPSTLLQDMVMSEINFALVYAIMQEEIRETKIKFEKNK